MNNASDAVVDFQIKYWMAIMKNTAKCNRPKVEQLINTSYKTRGLVAPKRIYWVSSPKDVHPLLETLVPSGVTITREQVAEATANFVDVNWAMGRSIAFALSGGDHQKFFDEFGYSFDLYREAHMVTFLRGLVVCIDRPIRWDESTPVYGKE